MKVTFLGAAETVTGSCFMIEADSLRFAVDCGMHQGNAVIEERNTATFAYRASEIDFFLITHAHIDHSGLLPRMVKDGFTGAVYCTQPTADLLSIMLVDSAHIQEIEAEWHSRKLKRRGAKPVEPLYTKVDAEKTVRLLSPVPYGQPFEPAAGLKVTYRNAGHILGAAFLELEMTTGKGTTRLIFSGDLGRPHALLLEDAETPALSADYLFLESTYGDRDHKSENSSLDELAEAIQYSHSQGEKVIIPAFAVERTQEILFSLYKLSKAGKLPEGIPVFVDSPLAIKATEIFRNHPEYFDKETRDVMANGEDPFDVPGLRFTPSTEESKAINAMEGPAIILSASGMCNAGRVKHHLRHNLWRPGASIVFVGYQGIGTPGRKIVDGAKNITMLGEETTVAARVFTINGFSAHAGQSQIVDWVAKFIRKGMHVVLIHGEEKAQNILADQFEKRFGRKGAQSNLSDRMGAGLDLTIEIPGYLKTLPLAPGEEVMELPAFAKAEPYVGWDSTITGMERDLTQLRGYHKSLSERDWRIQTELHEQLTGIGERLRQLISQIQ